MIVKIKMGKTGGMGKIAGLILLICFLFAACASKPKFKGKGDLCGLVIDENNQPVKDFVVHCSSADGQVQIINPVITNESGIFVFYDVNSGKYNLSGKKNNYLEIEKVSYSFDDRSKIICLQTKTINAAFAKAEELIRLGQPAEAGKILDGICCEPKSREKLLVKAYKYFSTEKAREKKSLLADMKKAGKHEDLFFKTYAEKLEASRFEASKQENSQEVN